MKRSRLLRRCRCCCCACSGCAGRRSSCGRGGGREAGGCVRACGREIEGEWAMGEEQGCPKRET